MVVIKAEGKEYHLPQMRCSVPSQKHPDCAKYTCPMKQEDILGEGGGDASVTAG